MQALYIAIKDELLARIEDGTYPVGSIIPSEVELAESYGVSRPTVRQALQLLADDGYLDRRRRRGTIVCDPTRPEAAGVDKSAGALPANPQQGLAIHGNGEVTAVLRRIDGDPVESARRVRTITVRAQREGASVEVADALGVASETPVYKLVRIRYMDNDPNIFIVSHILADLYPSLLDDDLSHKRMYVRMSEVGRPVVRARRRLELREADATLAEILDVPQGEPLFLFRVIGYDDQGKAVEYSRTIYRGKENAFEFSTEHELPPDD